jgi:methionine-rich copper-binding protein CopC/uncharacterized protein YcnI
VQPGSAEGGGFSVVAFRVPNERDDASTTQLRVTLPKDQPLGSVQTTPMPGWKITTGTRHLDKPIEMFGERLDTVVSEVTWTATDGGIRPGQFQDFNLSLGQLPKSGELVFNVLQSYSGGEKVNWNEISADPSVEPEHPAPILSITPAAAETGSGASDPVSQADRNEQVTTADQSGNASNRCCRWPFRVSHWCFPWLPSWSRGGADHFPQQRRRHQSPAVRMSTSERPAGCRERTPTAPGISHSSRGSALMASLITTVRRAGLLLTLVAVFAVLFASPAAAHAELVSITPANGAQLTSPPTKVQMTFTESVNLIKGGIRLINDSGATVPTSEPTVRGSTLTWPLPADLPKGAYVITWRVVSSDGHPVSGASSFGIGTAAVDVPGLTTGTETLGAAGSSVATGAVAPWPVVFVRLAGYLAFALFAGVAAFVLLCAPDTSKESHSSASGARRASRWRVAAVAAVLVQGPYTAGVSMSRVFDTHLVQQTLATPFGHCDDRPARALRRTGRIRLAIAQNSDPGW